MLIIIKKIFFCLIFIASALTISFGITIGAQEGNTGINKEGVKAMDRAIFAAGVFGVCSRLLKSSMVF